MSKKLAIFTFIAILFSAPLSAFAQSNVLIIDIERVFVNSMAGKSMMEQLKKKGGDLKSKRDKAQTDLTAEAKKLESQRTLLDPTALQSKADELRLKEIATNQELQQDARQVEAGRQAAQSEILTALSPILKEIMVEKKAVAVFNRTSVLIGSPDVDITDIAVKRLDGKLKSVKVQAPKK